LFFIRTYTSVALPSWILTTLVFYAIALGIDVFHRLTFKFSASLIGAKC